MTASPFSPDLPAKAVLRRGVLAAALTSFSLGFALTWVKAAVAPECACPIGAIMNGPTLGLAALIGATLAAGNALAFVVTAGLLWFWRLRRHGAAVVSFAVAGSVLAALYVFSGVPTYFGPLPEEMWGSGEDLLSTFLMVFANAIAPFVLAALVFRVFRGKPAAPAAS